MTIRRPTGLGPEGSRLWREVSTGLVLDVGDSALLGAACRTADEIALMETELAGAIWIEGASGQKRLSPVLAQLSVHRGRLAALLRQVLPEAEHESSSTAAANLARRRWDKQRGA